MNEFEEIKNRFEKNNIDISEYHILYNNKFDGNEIPDNYLITNDRKFVVIPVTKEDYFGNLEFKDIELYEIFNIYEMYVKNGSFLTLTRVCLLYKKN